jgi:hypothetical protein
MPGEMFMAFVGNMNETISALHMGRSMSEVDAKLRQAARIWEQMGRPRNILSERAIAILDNMNKLIAAYNSLKDETYFM